MIETQRSRVNQKLYQARLFIEAGQEFREELTRVAWQQACHEAALNALESAQLAFLREIAAAYRLNPQLVNSQEDLQREAAKREQQLPELVRLQAAQQDLTNPLSRLTATLDFMRRAPLAGSAVPEAVAVQEEVAVAALEASGNILLVNVQESSSPEMQQLADARGMHLALKSLVEELREGLRED
ncbi:DUF6586 family protein [Marinospirillum perlucidum]|uniref:DUF6586 family protein n=1 Tax=Marinospirillum perlucidum TaxID=1982602 RepID=UPI000DF32C94|nr:DUF6586 family protein [Marinospirillum perlucidum]